MNPLRTLHPALLLCLLLFATPLMAAKSDTVTVIAGADSCTLVTGEPCFVATAGKGFGFVDMQTGMLLATKTVDSHPQEVLDLVAAATADIFEFGTTRLGAFAVFSGPGYIEKAGKIVATDKDAEWYVSEWGDFQLEIAGQVFSGHTRPKNIFFTLAPEESPDTADGGVLTHELGHWLGIYQVFGPPLDMTIAIGAPDVEGYPDVAGLFRDTAEGETGHAHGHLDYLKQVGDPATNGPSDPETIRFEGEGEATFEFADGTMVVSPIKLETDSRDGTLMFEATALKLSVVLPYRMLPCLNRCKDGVFHGPENR